MIPAVFSPDRLYRYTLYRTWDSGIGFLQVIGLNPSTADETQDDPTVRRCIGYAKDWGFKGLCMTNIFAWRDTLPENMKKASDPIGLHNDYWLLEMGKDAGCVLAAWGTHGSYLNRGYKVRSLFRDAGIQLFHIGLNKDRSPKHPLYLKKDAKREPYDLR